MQWCIQGMLSPAYHLKSDVRKSGVRMQLHHRGVNFTVAAKLSLLQQPLQVCMHSCHLPGSDAHVIITSYDKIWYHSISISSTIVPGFATGYMGGVHSLFPFQTTTTSPLKGATGMGRNIQCIPSMELGSLTSPVKYGKDLCCIAPIC